MLRQLHRPIDKQPEIAVLTPLVPVKHVHVKMTRKVSLKDAWGGELIEAITPAEHKALCECVVLGLVQMTDTGKFILGNLAGEFLEQHYYASDYHFFDTATKEVVVIGTYEVLLLQNYSFDEYGMTGVKNEKEKNALKLLERVGFVGTRESDDGIDFYITKGGVNFLIEEGYLLG